MKTLFAKLIYGFLFGIGLSLAIFVSAYTFQEMFMRSFLTEHITESAEVDYSKSDLVLTNHQERKIDNGVIVLGAIENTGTAKWGQITLEAELFDKNEKFVEECSGYTISGLKPGQKENFKIKCGGVGCVSANKFPEYEKITVRVKRAWPSHDRW